MGYDYSVFENVKGSGKFVEFHGKIVNGMLEGNMRIGVTTISISDIFWKFPFWLLEMMEGAVEEIIENKETDLLGSWYTFSIDFNKELRFIGVIADGKSFSGFFIYRYKLLSREILFREFFSCLNKEELYALKNRIEDIRMSKYTHGG